MGKLAIIISGIHGNSSACRGIYVAYRLGYDPIIVVAPPDSFDYPKEASLFCSPILYHERSVLERQIRARTSVNEASSGQELLRIIEEQAGCLREQLFVYISVHGDSSGEFLKFKKDEGTEPIPATPFREAIDKIRYSQRFVLGSMCSGQTFLELTVLQQPRTVAVSSLGAGEAQALSKFNPYFLDRCLEGLTIREAYEAARAYVNETNDSMHNKPRTPFYRLSEGADPNLTL
ncbi:MAG TPA: hypothetical protein VJB90_04655 [Candidatus Nanoarchaeia archaeon]|nr:hypothetical protein [Candidatus Nanoarchaeia archaeon]